MSKQRCDVVVVGAGLAGLTAAFEMRELDVRVLEAGPRVSSRSQHGELGGVRITIGGEDWADTNPNSYERSLIHELGVPMVAVEGSGGLIWEGELLRATSLPELLSLLPVSDDAKKDFTATYHRINDAAATLTDPRRGATLARELVSIRGSEWLGDRHPEVLQYYRRLFMSEFSVPLEEISALYLIYLMPAYGGSGFDAWATYDTPPGGAPDIVEALVRRLPTPPVTGALVTSVIAEDGGCRVRYRSHDQEHEVSARHVVMATPAWMIPRIVPDLPSWKIAALSTIRPDPVVEMHVLVHEGGPAPWDDLICGWGIDTRFGVILPSQTDRANRAAAPTSDKHSIIHLMALGGAAAPFIDRNDEQISSAFLGDFLRAFPMADGRIEGWRIQRWSWGVTRPRFGYERHVPALLRPVGNLHFAGDWVSFVNDNDSGGFGLNGRWEEYCVMMCLHAAMRSGVRAAGEILGRSE